MINIVYEDNQLLVVEKPINVLVQSDDTNDIDLLTLLKKYLKEKYDKKGNVYLGLVHRLDRPVGGIMVFAKTSKSASRLSEQIRNGEFHKVYYAVINGIIKDKHGVFEDRLLKDHKTNTVTVADNGKLALLEYDVVDEMNNMSLVRINLQTGRSHQIRVQFSSRGYPLVGDHRYNKLTSANQPISLFAEKLTFNHPTTKNKISFSLKLPNYYPWNVFKASNKID